MKKEQLYRAIGNVDEELIAEATSYKKDAPRYGKLVSVMVAIICVIAMAGTAAAAGLFSNMEITTETIDHDDPAWKELLETAPNATVMQHVKWEPHNKLATGEIESLLAEMDGKESSDSQFNSVQELEETYGIKLLKPGQEVGPVQATLGYCDPSDPALGSHLHGVWDARADGVELSIDFSGFFNSSEYSTSEQAFTKIESVDEYEIQSLGVTAAVISGLIEQDEQTERLVAAYFSFGGIDYTLTARPTEGQDEVTATWLCERLETLQEVQPLPQGTAETIVVAKENDESAQSDKVVVLIMEPIDTDTFELRLIIPDGAELEDHAEFELILNPSDGSVNSIDLDGEE